MWNVKKIALVALVLALSLIFSLVALGQPADLNSFRGNVSIGGSSSASGGAVVEAFIGGASSAADSYTVGTTFPLPEYSMDISCGAGSTAFLKVWGINATTQTCSNLLVNYTNMSVSLVANDGACSYANACSSGFCCSGSTAINTSSGSGVCQAAACGTGISIPGFVINSTSIINTQTLNFTINISSVLRYNITAANFTLATPTGVLSRNFTIPSNGKNFNISYKIFNSDETAIPGTYNITSVQVNDNGSISNLTTITTLNFTVTSRLTIPNLALSAASITTAQTVNFTVNLNDTYYNITAANFTLLTPSGNISRNFTIPSNGRNFNLSYKIFNSAETATAGTYNITAIQVNDNGSITNLTVIANMNFTVTAVAASTTPDSGGGGSSGAGGGGGGGGAGGASAAPSQETIDVVKESLPATFQVAADAGNVDYKAVAAPEIKDVPKADEAVATALVQVETAVKTAEAKQAVSAIEQAVSSGGATTVQSAGGSVKKTIEVVKATNKATKEEVTVSVVKLSVVAPANKDLNNVEVVEVIPKAAASNVNQVMFKGEQPTVLEADPVVKWFFSQVARGQKKDMSYTVNKDIRNIGTSTVAVQGRAEAAPAVAPEAPPAPPAPVVEKGEEKPPVEVKKPSLVNSLVLVVVILVAVVGAWMFIKGRKKGPGKGNYHP
ncbi:hypothetical protein HYU17_02230 [Candidatus Woesearchaeota archaeon]|nr:hypothetical protein [Candidatus Woesearchaeota archaeon]